jgi:hypothetical protein
MWVPPSLRRTTVRRPERGLSFPAPLWCREYLEILKKLCKLFISARKMTFQNMEAAQPRCCIVGKLTP